MTSLVQKIPVDSNRHEFVMTQNAWKRCCCITLLTWLVYFPPITLLLIVYWHTGDYKETFDVKSTKIAQTTQNIWNLLSESQLYKKWQNSAIIQGISYSNLETGRYGPKSGVSQIIRESWQHCLLVLAEMESYRMVYFFSIFSRSSSCYP